MKITFLGTGTSFGVPVVGCDCDTCRSEDPRDKRMRSGALIDLTDARLLVDTSPELRLQLLNTGVSDLDAVWITHTHADHLHGIDDLRAFSVRRDSPLPVYASDYHAGQIRQRFSYIFDDQVVPPIGTSKPRLELRPIELGTDVRLGAHLIRPIGVPHGEETVYGFRVGGLGYITDGKTIPPAAMKVLEGVDVLVLNALWFGNPHPTHFNVEEAIEAAREVGAGRTYLVHLTHRVSHSRLLAELPAGVEPAYDGLTVEI